jgi:hypothetical protein
MNWPEKIARYRKRRERASQTCSPMRRIGAEKTGGRDGGVNEIHPSPLDPGLRHLLDRSRVPGSLSLSLCSALNYGALRADAYESTASWLAATTFMGLALNARLG